MLFRARQLNMLERRALQLAGMKDFSQVGERGRLLSSIGAVGAGSRPILAVSRTLRLCRARQIKAELRLF